MENRFSARIRGAGLLAACLCRYAPAPGPSNSRKRIGNSPYTFQCGKHAAHRNADAATTTAGRKPMRQCFAVCNSGFRLTSDRVRVFGRIVKKLTNSLWEPNRPERRVPEATIRALYGMSHWRLWFPSPLLRILALPGYREDGRKQGRSRV